MNDETAEALSFILSELDEVNKRVDGLVARESINGTNNLNLDLLCKNLESRVDFLEDNFQTVVDTVMTHTTRINELDKK